MANCIGCNKEMEGEEKYKACDKCVESMKRLQLDADYREVMRESHRVSFERGIK